jgi:hypothetical protein
MFLKMNYKENKNIGGKADDNGNIDNGDTINKPNDSNGVDNKTNTNYSSSIGNKTNANYNIGYNKKDNSSNITLNSIEHVSIGEMLTYRADTLFNLFNKAKEESDRANIRRKWIEGVIELKYKSTINDFYKKASEYINNEPIEEMDRYHKDVLIYYIPDADNKENMIKVEFYRGISDISGEVQIKKRLSLVKRKNYGGYNG